MRLIKRLILNSSPFSIILNIHTNILQLLLFKNKQKKLLWPHVPLISFLSLLYVTFIENSLYLLILIPGCSPTLPSHFFFVVVVGTFYNCFHLHHSTKTALAKSPMSTTCKSSSLSIMMIFLDPSITLDTPDPSLLETLCSFGSRMPASLFYA